MGFRVVTLELASEDNMRNRHLGVSLLVCMLVPLSASAQSIESLVRASIPMTAGSWSYRYEVPPQPGAVLRLPSAIVTGGVLRIEKHDSGWKVSMRDEYPRRAAWLIMTIDTSKAGLHFVASVAADGPIPPILSACYQQGRNDNQWVEVELEVMPNRLEGRWRACGVEGPIWALRRKTVKQP